jgi:anaerobic carbon-monoxide dehydrogenase iron sulfur subunit
LAKHKFVNLDIDKCVGCRVCEYVCSLEKNKSFNPTRSRIRMLRIYPHTNAALNCRLCEDTPCVSACPRKALTQSEENGVIIVNDDLCNGCGWCIEACDFGAIFIDAKKVARMCDLCATREGGPACVEWCPEKALELTTTDILAQKKRMDAVQRLIKANEENKQEGETNA